MSEPAPQPQPSSGGGGIKGMLTHKFGPLPMWIWALLVAAIILGYVVIKGRGSQQQPTTGATAGACEVPQFVNQTFTSVSPPPAADQDGDEDKGKGKSEDDDNDADDRPHSHPLGKPPHPKPPHRRPVPVPPEKGQPGGGKGGPPRRKTHGPPMRPPHRVHRRKRVAA